MGGIVFQIVATVVEAYILKHMSYIECDWCYWGKNGKDKYKITEKKVGLKVWMLIALIFFNFLHWVSALILFIVTLLWLIIFSEAMQERDGSYFYFRVDSKTLNTITNFLFKSL